MRTRTRTRNFEMLWTRIRTWTGSVRTRTRTRTLYFKILWTRTRTGTHNQGTRTRTLKNGKFRYTGSCYVGDKPNAIVVGMKLP